MRWPFIVLLAVMLTACMSEEVEYYPRSDAGATDTEDSDGSGDTGDQGPERWVGHACEVDRDCNGVGSQCITRATLDTFGVGDHIELPGGMCSKLFCQRDEQCGPGGTCFDASFLGAPVSLCLQRCNDLSECRWRENWSCMAFSVVADEDAEDIPEGGACVSASIEVAILCDDGHCEDQFTEEEE